MYSEWEVQIVSKRLLLINVYTITFLQSFVESCGSTRPQGYPPDCLSCEVEIGNEDYNDCPFDSEYRETYSQKYSDYLNVSKWNFSNQNLKYQKRLLLVIELVDFWTVFQTRWNLYKTVCFHLYS